MPIIPNNTPFVLLTNLHQPDKGTTNGQHTYNKRNRSTATCVQCPFLIVPECLRCPPNQVCSVSVQTCDTCPGFSCIDVAKTYINNTGAQACHRRRLTDPQVQQQLPFLITIQIPKFQMLISGR